MITSRFSFRRWVAALSLSLAVAGCAGRDQQVSQNDGKKFWERDKPQPTAVAETGDEKGEKSETGRVRIASLGADEPEAKAGGVDPFLDETQAEKPVRQVVARDSRPEPAAKPTAKPTQKPAPQGWSETVVEEELARLRREATIDEGATAQPSMEWADDESSVARQSPARQPAAEAVESLPTPVHGSVDVERKTVVNPDLIVDSIEIRPRTIHDPSIRETAATREALRREVEAAAELAEADEGARDAAWSLERDGDVENETIPASNESADEPAPNAPAAKKPAADPFALIGPDPTDSTEDALTTAPLLVPPTSLDDSEEVAEIDLPAEGMALPGPALVGPETAEAIDEVTKADDEFPYDPDPEVVTALDSLEFSDDPEPAATPATSSIGWWFGGIALAAIALLLRARKRLMA